MFQVEFDPPPSPPRTRISLQPMSTGRRLICYPGLGLRIVHQDHLRAFPGPLVVATSNTGLNGTLGLSTQSTACLAPRREAWSRPLGANPQQDLPEQTTRPALLGEPFQASSASRLWWRRGRVGYSQFARGHDCPASGRYAALGQSHRLRLDPDRCEKSGVNTVVPRLAHGTRAVSTETTPSFSSPLALHHQAPDADPRLTFPWKPLLLACGLPI